MATEREMPKYRCHKEVWALKIQQIEPDHLSNSAYLIVEEDFAPVQVSEEYLLKHKPYAGGYYVVYPDGYKSFSPAAAFELGYTRI